MCSRKSQEHSRSETSRTGLRRFRRTEHDHAKMATELDGANESETRLAFDQEYVLEGTNPAGDFHLPFSIRSSKLHKIHVNHYVM